jgi:myo-inositol-1(or 4)-monophosphatase
MNGGFSRRAINWEREFRAAKVACHEARRLLVADFVKDAGVESIAAKDIKTAADRHAEKIIENVLQPLGFPMLSEENRKDVSAERGVRWLIDPLDGTMNFSRGFPFCAVSVALWKDEEPILGVVHDLFSSQVYGGVVGEGAWLDEQPINVSSLGEHSQAMLATGFPSGRDYGTEALGMFVGKIQQFKKVRMLGAASLMLAQVAAGRFDVYEEEDIYLWDVAAGVALVAAAGGRVHIRPGSSKHKCHVLAWNGTLPLA